MQYIKCPSCNGSGEIFMDDLGRPFQCDTCRGNGILLLPSRKTLCPKCGGTRVIFLPTGFSSAVQTDCKTCEGTGFVSA